MKDKLIGKQAYAGGIMKRFYGTIIKKEIDEYGWEFYILMSPTGETGKYSKNEITIIPNPTRKETYDEKVDHVVRLCNISKEEAENFIAFVYKQLDSCGYLEGDYNIHGFPEPEQLKPYKILYRERDFGKWLLDFALQYNMEQGMEYDCKFKFDRHEYNKEIQESLKED